MNPHRSQVHGVLRDSSQRAVRSLFLGEGVIQQTYHFFFKPEVAGKCGQRAVEADLIVFELIA
jgi:hypothetical protein